PFLPPSRPSPSATCGRSSASFLSRLPTSAPPPVPSTTSSRSCTQPMPSSSSPSSGRSSGAWACTASSPTSRGQTRTRGREGRKAGGGERGGSLLLPPLGQLLLDLAGAA
ncbi:hypothetical protein Naga_104235g1, partial [Nannochloropsis gaditana]